jgi:hypothetical protein
MFFQPQFDTKTTGNVELWMDKSEGLILGSLREAKSRQV